MTGQYFIIANYEWLQQKGDLAVAGTFMHELGHTLGLNHGGQDGDNYKPNYLSIMNYSFQSDGLYPNAELNYSEYKLADIDETALDEFSSLEEGLPTPTGLETIWYLADSANPNQYVQSPPVDISKALNYNMNNTQDPSPYSMDVNQDKKTTVLKRYTDWDKLIFKSGDIGAASQLNASSLAAEPAPAGLTLEEAIRSNLIDKPGHGKLHFSGPFTLIYSAGRQNLFIDVQNYRMVEEDFIL